MAAPLHLIMFPDFVKGYSEPILTDCHSADWGAHKCEHTIKKRTKELPPAIVYPLETALFCSALALYALFVR